MSFCDWRGVVFGVRSWLLFMESSLGLFFSCYRRKGLRGLWACGSELMFVQRRP